MKKIAVSSVLALLSIALVCQPALADGPRGYGTHRGGHHGGHHHRHHGDASWVAPLLFLGLAGAVIGAAASQPNPPPVYVQPAPTYVPPVTYAPSPTYAVPAPVYVAPAPVSQLPPPQPAGTWYFCRSVGQYYPYTPHCPEGWQAVPAAQ